MQREKIYAALPVLLPHLSELRDPWWLIGSASLLLLGLDVPVADIDVLTSTADVGRLATSLAACRTAGLKTDDQFRSEFAEFTINGVIVEVMGDLQLRQGKEWIKVSRLIHRTETSSYLGYPLRMPSLRDQLTIYEAFDRGKDSAKLQKIRNALARRS